MILCNISYSTFSILCYSWMALGVMTFFILLKINPPYGRHTSKNWGPFIENSTAWFLMEFPVLIVVGSLAFWNNPDITPGAIVSAGLFCAHYIHRSIVFPLRLKTKGKKMPVVIMMLAIVFNCLNGFFIGYYLRNFDTHNSLWFGDFRFIAGLVLFSTGMVLNILSDTMLIRLRNSSDNSYKIPRGFLFVFVSCPNHLGEIVEWLGFALLCWNLPALSFFVWTIANLLPRSLAHHRWYQQRFPEYPAKRKAVIPYII